MTLSARNKTISSKYVLVTCIAVVLSWVLHEFAHWVAGTLLGYEMGMTFNKAFPANGYTTDWHYQVISAAGPVFTLIEAFVVFMIMQRRKIILLYPFLFTCFYMRLFAALISVRHPNDEARISKSTGPGYIHAANYHGRNSFLFCL